MDKKETYLYAIKLLAKRDYSHAKLASRLKEKGATPQDIEDVLKALIEKNFLRQDEYILSRVKGLLRKGLANRAIQHRMDEEECSVSLDVIEQIRLEYGLDVWEQLQKLVEKKAPRPEDLETYQSKQRWKARTLRYLVSKGHSTQHCLEVMEQQISRD